jgi:hypothetical protein
LYIDGDVNFGATGTRKNITNIGALYRNSSGYPFIQMVANSIYLQPETSGFAGAISRSTNAELLVKGEAISIKSASGYDVTITSGDDILLDTADSGNILTIYDWTTTTGSNNYAGGSILVKVGGDLRRIKLWKVTA